ncbi:hypothetical protein GQX74_003496 [Glossina fuscipes]|nr:hypothetical protein GQX74_003496 [Glossina fuscipes]
MGTKSPGGPQRCRLILKQCLSIQLTKPGHTPEDFWMYDSGYMIFQNFLAANAQCWWNGPLTAATRGLKYAGHVAPGMLLITGEPCALEVIRGAYARSVLKAPATYLINSVELFTLSNEDLEKRLNKAQGREINDEERKRQTRSWERLNEMKSKLIERQDGRRLKGGANPNIWDIMIRAAAELDEVVGGGSYDYEDDYDDSSSCPSPGDISYDESYEENFNPDAVIMATSTPVESTSGAANVTYNADAARNVRPNETYTASPGATVRSATFTRNATYSSPRGAVRSTSRSYVQCPPRAANQTYKVNSPEAKALAESPAQSNQTYAVPSDRTYSAPNDRTYNVPRERTFNVAKDRTYAVPGDRTFNVPLDQTYVHGLDRTYPRAYSCPAGQRTYNVTPGSGSGSSYESPTLYSPSLSPEGVTPPRATPPPQFGSTGGSGTQGFLYQSTPDCIVTPIIQGQFTPLHEAICDVIMDLTTVGHSATIENVRNHLEVSFPHMTTPSVEVVYDTLAQLMQEQKIYQTAKGYFILTPERRRSRSRPRSHHNGCTDLDESLNNGPQEVRTILMTNVEALHSLYGEISTERDGDLTHQCIQTNLADVICGGNSNDKILYPRTSKRRSSSFPTPRSLERRHSLRLFGSSKRLQRCSSTRSLSKAYAQTLHNTDSSSSEYQSTDSSSPKKGSLLSRLFRRSGRNKSRQLETYSAQFPPVEWFNSKAVHLHSVGTQTADHDLPTIRTLSNSTFYDGLELSQRSLTLPRRHRRQLSSESTFLISSRDCSPIRRRSPVYSSSSLPRSTQSIPATANNITKGAITNTTNSFSARLSNPYKCPNTQKSGQISRHILEHSPSRSTNSSKMMISSNKYQDNKCEQRNLASGPSSLESGKTSTFNSGPSSIESSKASLNNKTSGHSSLDSQRSNSSTTIQPKHQTRSIIMLNGSPRGTPRHQIMRARNAEQASSFNHQPAKTATTPTISNLSANASTTSFTLTPDRTHTLENYESSSAPISNSTSNNSITLKVTTSNDNQNSLPNTKIVVQNTPAQSVITFENSQLTENSSVFIINNETTTNERGEVLRKTLSKHPNPLDTTASTKTSQSVIDQFAENERIQSTNYKTRSSILKENYLKDQYNYNVTDTFDISAVTSSNQSTVQQKLATTKSLYNETAMNNSRKLSVPSTLLTNNSNRLVYKNNVLRGDGSQTVSSNDEKSHDDKPNVEISGSMGNLRFFEKNSRDGLTKAINSNCELNNLRYESTIASSPAKPTKLNSNSSLSGNNLVHILQKNSIGIGSEPNLSQKDNNCVLTADEKSIKKESLNRRFSITKEPSTEEGTDELCNFPSLTDLSFNFTSLAAQKILQGVSLNSIDTLVELNMAAAAAAASVNTTIEKSQNNQNTVCTDYGLV